MRPGWDDYFMQVAQLVATRATCDRKHVGAVIVVRNRIMATGYNGSPSGLPHCDDVGHQLRTMDGRESCIRTIHAEANALHQAGDHHARGGTLYVTVIPCYDCAKLVVNAGLVRVVYGEYYESRYTCMVHEFFKAAGVSMELRKVGG